MSIHIFIEIFLSLCILAALEIAIQRTRQRDRFADLFKNTLDRYEELKVVTKLQREEIAKDNILLQRHQDAYNDLHKKYQSNCSDSKDCK
jgi:hypothetical protein